MALLNVELRRAVAAAIAAAIVLTVSPHAEARTQATGYYLAADDVDLTMLLAPPPEANSPMERDDEKAVATMHVSRTEAELRQASADRHRSVFAFGSVLGAAFSPERTPLAAMLFLRVGSDTKTLIDEAKAYFGRPRPSGVSEKHPSYPSGHAAFAACTAILLSEMIPEKRDAIFDRAEVFARGRLVAGVHYPSDVTAGWIAGTVVAAALLRQPKFTHDFDAAKAEVRQALGLP